MIEFSRIQEHIQCFIHKAKVSLNKKCSHCNHNSVLIMKDKTIVI